VLLEGKRQLGPFLELAAEDDECAEDESSEERVEVRRAHGHGPLLTARAARVLRAGNVTCTLRNSYVTKQPVNTTVFQALADPTRRRVLELLAEREQSAGEIAAAFPVSRPAVSRHLRVLREAGLVSSRRDAQRRVYGLDPEPLAELDAWLAAYRPFWHEKLDLLEKHLQRTREET
jgi:DNA-binding transcriptional ArsR family regulator